MVWVVSKREFRVSGISLKGVAISLLLWQGSSSSKRTTPPPQPHIQYERTSPLRSSLWKEQHLLFIHLSETSENRCQMYILHFREWKKTNAIMPSFEACLISGHLGLSLWVCLMEQMMNLWFNCIWIYHFRGDWHLILCVIKVVFLEHASLSHIHVILYHAL